MKNKNIYLKSKIFRKLFLSYIFIICSFYGLFSCLAMYEAYVINNERIDYENNMKIQKAIKSIEFRVATAQNIVQSINSASSFRKLYTDVHINEKVLDSYSLYSVMNDMASISNSSGRIDIDEVALFLNEYDKSYTTTSVVNLKNPFEYNKNQLPTIELNTIKESLNVEANGRFTFLRKNLLYLDDYKYSSGSPKGVIAVSFDLNSLKRDLKNILGKESIYQIYWKDTLLFGNGEFKNEDNTYILQSNEYSQLRIESEIPNKEIMSSSTKILFIFLLGGLIITATFIFLAYRFSKRYYMPINNFANMIGVEMENQENKDEETSILDGLKNLIGERNVYKEKMLVITPYARAGMIHGMLTGNIENSSIQIISEENYLDLQKPYFTVSVINFAYKNPKVDLEQHKKKIFEMFPKIVSIFSDETSALFHYKKDIFNVFLVVNSYSEEQLDSLFYQIHKFIIGFIEDENCLITIGIDEVRDNISDLQSACDNAEDALKLMGLNGRGEVYFYEEKEKTNINYYFPKNSSKKLVKIMHEGDVEEIKEFLNDIYEKNIEKSKSDTIYVENIIDELHVLTLKAIQILNVLHINVTKMDKVTTIEEIFDYYIAVLCTVYNESKKADKKDTDGNVDEDIIEYIKNNYKDSELSLSHISDKFKVSNKYITLLCKEELGITYLQYVNNKRVEEAINLLNTTEHSLETIAKLSGFTNQLTFRRNFKLVTNQNPSEYKHK